MNNVTFVSKLTQNIARVNIERVTNFHSRKKIHRLLIYLSKLLEHFNHDYLSKRLPMLQWPSLHPAHEAGRV